ncbi:MAG: cellulase family glycosylhydrolase [Acidobacteria bacterium]|nr:cellulase family glycosylhydrolase [Acidobacteriota bacterium]
MIFRTFRFPLLAVLVCALIETVNALPRRGMMLAPRVYYEGTTTPIDLGTSQRILQDHINVLANNGANIVRLPIYFASVQNSTNWWIGLADAAYETCWARGVNLVIDFHWPGTLPNSTITNDDDFVRKWERFAAHFAGKAQDARMNIWYDLCNEPRASNWEALALRTAQAIRRYDTKSRIVYAYRGTTIPTSISTSYKPLSGISNQIAEFHFYNWNKLQLSFVKPPSPIQACGVDVWDGNYRYPDSLNSFTRTKMQEILTVVRNYGRNNNVPVYIGETAIFQGHPDASQFMADFTSVSDELGIHLTLHVFREDKVWNYECGPNVVWNTIINWMMRR